MVRDEIMNILLNKNANELNIEVAAATEEELKTAIAMCELTKRSSTRVRIMEKELKFREKEKETRKHRQWSTAEIKAWEQMRRAAERIKKGYGRKNELQKRNRKQN